MSKICRNIKRTIKKQSEKWVCHIEEKSELQTVLKEKLVKTQSVMKKKNEDSVQHVLAQNVSFKSHYRNPTITLVYCIDKCCWVRLRDKKQKMWFSLEMKCFVIKELGRLLYLEHSVLENIWSLGPLVECWSSLLLKHHLTMFHRES